MENVSGTAVPSPVVHLAIVDDNTFYRDWLGQAGTFAAHHHVVARAADASALATLLVALPDRRCDVILLDLRISSSLDDDPAYGGGSPERRVQGSPAVQLLKIAAERAVRDGQLDRSPAILVYTQESAPRVHVACLLAGADGVVHKSASLGWLRYAIDVVAAGGFVVDDRMAALIELLAHERGVELTESENAVLALAGHGLARKDIAIRLQSSESTVDKHLRSIRDKFGDDTPLPDLADAFGLRDLAPPSAIGGKAQRERLRVLGRRLSHRRQGPT